MNTDRRSLSTLRVLMACCLLASPASGKIRTLEFKGEALFEKRTGLVVMPDRERDNLVISSELHHFFLVLPYSETWRIRTGKKLPLEAIDETHMVTIRVVPRREEDERAHLVGILQSLSNSGQVGIRSVEFLESHGRVLLRYRAQPGRLPEDFRQRDPWFWNYWAVAPRASVWYVLHLSLIDPSIDLGRHDARLRAMLGAGFRADFPAAAQGEVVHRYPVPGHGLLELTVPSSWRGGIEQPVREAPPTITFRPREGKEFLVMVTPLWSPTGDPDFNSVESVRQLVEAEGAEHLASAVETKIALQRFEGGTSHGYYYMLTDRAPERGEFEFLVRAGAAVGDLLISATVLTDERDSQVVREALAMLKSAAQSGS